jgi:hypothetical protein
MTETQAHKFIERWERISFPLKWRAKTEAQAAHRLKGLLIGLICGAIGVMLTSPDDFTIEVCAFLIFSFLFWQYWRSRKACRVLGCL